MTIKYKKNRSKYRGSRHCGWGIQGQHRKKGKAGGRGKTGLAKHKWSWTVVHDPDYFGKHGFKRPPAVEKKSEMTTINIKQLEERLPHFIGSGVATKKGSIVAVDLTSAGIDKLLATGQLHGKYDITVASASAKAIEKVQSAGGSVTTTEPAGA